MGNLCVRIITEHLNYTHSMYLFMCANNIFCVWTIVENNYRNTTDLFTCYRWKFVGYVVTVKWSIRFFCFKENADRKLYVACKHYFLLKEKWFAMLLQAKCRNIFIKIHLKKSILRSTYKSIPHENIIIYVKWRFEKQIF